jgi:transposase
MKTKRSKAKIGAGRKSISMPCSEPAKELQILRPDAAGIDCGAQEHYVAVPPDRVSVRQSTVRRFSAFTEGLDAVVDWLKDCRVTTVAMESTGVYWIPLHQKLETAGIEVYQCPQRAAHRLRDRRRYEQVA